MTTPRISFADGLVGFLVGAELSEAIIGDLKEQAGATATPDRSLAFAILKSLPGLIQLGLSNVSFRRFRIELFWLTALLTIAWAWELKIAQVFAWPMASTLTTISPFSITLTCKLAYLALFSLGLLMLMGGWRLMNRSKGISWRVRTQRFGATCLAGLVPVLYLLSFPGPYDGHPAFRYVQLGLVGVIGASMLLLSNRAPRLPYRPAS